jgi:Right handed beta helix region
MRSLLLAGLGLLCGAHVAFAESSASRDDGLRFPVGGRIAACVDFPRKCAERGFRAAEDMLPWVRALPANDTRYILRITLESGTHEVTSPWVIHGAQIPASVGRMEIFGSNAPRTRFVGSRRLKDLATRTNERQKGIISYALTASARRELTMNVIGQNTPGPPVLFDEIGSMPYAQWPNSGFADFADGVARQDGASFVPADPSRIARWRNESSAWVLGQFRYEWYFEHRQLVSASVASLHASIAGAPDYGIAPTGRFQILNALSELDEPREFHIDYRRHEIAIHENADKSASSLRLSLRKEPLLVLKNLTGAELRKLNFGETRGHGIVVEDCNDVELVDLDIRDVGRYAISVRGGARVRVDNSTVDNTGSYGIVLDGGDRATLRSGGHAIARSLITRPGQWVQTPSASVRLLGVGQAVRDTALLDAPQSAIYFDGNNHLIERNRIERACGIATDCGAIYSGRDWTFRGNAIRANTIAHLVPAVAGRTVAAIYLDDMLSGTSVTQNLVLASPYGVLIGGGRDNVVTNNLFVDSTVPIHVDDRALDWASRAVAPGEVMRQRLAAVPYQSQTWSAAYPELARMIIERAAWPDSNRVVSNSCSRCGALSVKPRAAEASRIETPYNLGETSIPSSPASILGHCALPGKCGSYRSPLR